MNRMRKLNRRPAKRKPQRQQKRRSRRKRQSRQKRRSRQTHQSQQIRRNRQQRLSLIPCKDGQNPSRSVCSSPLTAAFQR
nr:MAG TPA: hypothetical protein [Caudoviricetes sp.]